MLSKMIRSCAVSSLQHRQKLSKIEVIPQNRWKTTHQPLSASSSSPLKKWIGLGAAVVTTVGVASMLKTEYVACDPTPTERFFSKHTLPMDLEIFKQLNRAELNVILRRLMGPEFGSSYRPMHTIILASEDRIMCDIRLYQDEIKGHDDCDPNNYYAHSDFWMRKEIPGWRTVRIYGQPQLRPAPKYWLPKQYNIVQCIWNDETREYEILIGKEMYVLISVADNPTKDEQDILRRHPTHLEGVCGVEYSQHTGETMQQINATISKLKIHIPPPPPGAQVPPPPAHPPNPPPPGPPSSGQSPPPPPNTKRPTFVFKRNHTETQSDPASSANPPPPRQRPTSIQLAPQKSKIPVSTPNTPTDSKLPSFGKK